MGTLSRRWRAGGILVGLAFLALPLGSAAAATAPPPSTAIQIGPVALGGGYKLTIIGDCNVPNAYADASVMKTGRGYTLTHYYYGAKNVSSTCKTSSKYGSGSMALKWGKITVKMKFGHAGSKKRLVEKGCRGTAGHLRHVTGTGTLNMDVHTGTFGKLNLHRVGAEILIYDGSCSGSEGGVALSAGFAKGSEYVTGYTNARGKRFVGVSAPDNVSRRIRGTVSDTFESKNVFSFSSNLSSGKIAGFSPFLSGSLKYKASTVCTTGYTTGTMTGKLVWHDPVSGTFRLVGKKASFPGPTMYRNSGAC
jgi:hypothetical protein